MVQTTVNANDIQQYVLQTFGNKQLTAIKAGDVVLLIAGVQASSKDMSKEKAIGGLYGMFKNTSLLSSDEFSENKKIEKGKEDKKFSNEQVIRI